MARISILPEILSNKIAAGEVVERPASVVKELVENALDAKSTRITVEVEKGGRSLIRISDNGCGMGQDDALLAIERYATSKIRTDSDLFSISTLGFRGEALPSIASVSRFSLVTREKSSDAATSILIEGGKIKKVAHTGAPPGTMIDVKQLFFNTPARRKFLRTINTEMGHIADTVSTIALGWPKVQFRLIHNGRVMKNWPRAKDPFDRAVDVLGREMRRELTAVSHSGDDLSISGWTSTPSLTRSTSQKIHIYVNGRYIRDRGLSHALFQGYRGRIMKGRFPVAVLFITLPFDQLDVNVHPTKHEVRFADQRRVYDALKECVMRALSAADRPRWSEKGPSPASSLGGESLFSRGPAESPGRKPGAAKRALHESVPRDAGVIKEPIHGKVKPFQGKASPSAEGTPCREGAFSSGGAGTLKAPAGAGEAFRGGMDRAADEGGSTETTTHEERRSQTGADASLRGAPPSGAKSSSSGGIFQEPANDTNRGGVFQEKRERIFPSGEPEELKGSGPEWTGAAMDGDVSLAEAPTKGADGSGAASGEGMSGDGIDAGDGNPSPPESNPSATQGGVREKVPAYRGGGEVIGDDIPAAAKETTFGISAEEPLPAAPEEQESAGEFESGEESRAGQEGKRPFETPEKEPAVDGGGRKEAQAEIWEKRFFSDLTVIGQFRETYILCESREGLILIDQHAAHERIVYEELKKSAEIGRRASQRLLIPETVDFSFREADILLSMIPDLQKLGLTIEPFGGNTFVIKSVPPQLPQGEVKQLVEEIVEEMRETGFSPGLSDAIDRCTVLMACHGAIRARRSLTPAHMKRLLEQLDRCENPSHCPHGRPVWLSWTTGFLEKSFRRVV